MGGEEKRTRKHTAILIRFIIIHLKESLHTTPEKKKEFEKREKNEILEEHRRFFWNFC